MKASALFNNLFDSSSTAYKQLREIAISPERFKNLKTWGITDAAEMVGRTPHTIRKLEEQGKLPKPEIQKKGKREDRVYSLKHINHMRDVFGTRPTKPEGADPAIFCFVNFKGGAGKTTTAVNTSQYFALQGYRVLVVDCDSQGSATHMFGYIPDEDFTQDDTLLNTLIGEQQDLKTSIKKTYWDNIDIVPANLSLYNAELILPSEIAQAAAEGRALHFYDQLNQALKSVYDQYDIIILDCPPSMGMISINAIYAANIIAVEMPPVVVDFASTTQFFKMVAEVLERLPEKEYFYVKLLITKHNGRRNADEIYEMLKRFLGEHVMSSYMIESEAIKTASASMRTLYEIDKYVGNKKTYDRAFEWANRVNEEFETVMKMTWDKMLQKQTVLA
jgi:chromosome partitioning protein